MRALKRTGAIEVNEQDIDVRVGQLLRQFDPCTFGEGERGLQPTQDGSATPFSARDPETGNLHQVHVLLRPKPAKAWMPGGGTARISAPRGRLLREIVVEPNAKRCDTASASTRLPR